MRVRNKRAALLSDYEVLSMMREVDQTLKLATQKAAAEAEANEINQGNDNPADGISAPMTISSEDQYAALDRQEELVWKATIPPNLRQLQYNLYETLINTQRPCSHQNDAMIAAFLDAIAAWERGRSVTGIEERMSNAPIDKERRLTKGERLMLINHAPTTILELHTLIEEIEERFSMEEREDLLAIVAHTLPLDLEAIKASSERAAAAAIVGEYRTGDVSMLEQNGEEEIDDVVDDMDELQNEARGEAAVDDEIPDE